MATTPLPLTRTFSSPSARSANTKPPRNLRLFTVFAADVGSKGDTQPDPEPTRSGSNPDSDSDAFDSRLSRIRYRSGTGKKAEVRKAKKGSGGSAKKGSGIYLPAVSLKEPVSGGLKVEFGFSPYSERVNGRMAGLGLAALLLVELATGKSVLNYHTPAIVLIQVYSIAAIAALFIKYEKEKVSVWPKN